MRCPAHTMELSDFLSLYIIGVGHLPSQCDPLAYYLGSDRISRFSRIGFPYMLEVYDRAGLDRHLSYCTVLCSIPFHSTTSASWFYLFRGSIFCLYVPLSTLHLSLHRCRCMTRGHRD